MPTTTELTQAYILKHPSVKDGLKKGIVNYSKLSRRIAQELSLTKDTSIEAILIACRRYAEKIKKEAVHEDKIMHVLQKSELSIKNKIVVAIIDRKISYDLFDDLMRSARKSGYPCTAIEGSRAWTLVTSEHLIPEIKSRFKSTLLKLTPRQAMIMLNSSKDMETTHGIVAYLYGLFADHGVNILETMSCWTETIFVIDEKDVASVIQFLRMD